ncbi:anhydro-N-acetylmuramic acid kinase [Elongatibacter sediminis]|uniref:Anhydro-N-acetylmuramic acid kinase n=1 Tax=Elongatibacter sediminis TaxID=3119006 RepID=A0AAW9RAR0_9GAMM
MSEAPTYFIGMLSGTSRDGADTALVRFESGRPVRVETQCVEYPDDLAALLRRMVERRRRPDDEEMARADRELAEFFALAAWGLLDRYEVERSAVRAIGSHGQTVWHHPAGHHPESIQLGDPQRIADLTGIPVVGRFRQADLEAGGQGAPLAPLLHRALLCPESGRRAVLNIGGIANVSLLDPDGNVTGYDTGPGNCLLDAWVHKQRGENYDASGAWAESGTVDRLLLDQLLADPYFVLPPPKSTGVEYFNFYWLEGHLRERGPGGAETDPRDVQATLAEFTAASVAEAVLNAASDELLVCGGGTHNTDLMRRLKRLLPRMRVTTTAAYGLDPDWVEAILFAWLARERIAGRPQDTPPITGAREPVILGEIFQPH